MKTLAFDTSSTGFSLAILQDEKILSSRLILESDKQAELLIPAIEQILTQNQIDYRDLNLIAANKGPASFTGTRIGLTTARILQIATKLPLVLVNSCEAIAYKYHDKSAEILALIDAKADEFFYAKYSAEFNLESTTQPQLISLKDLNQIFPTQNFFLCGSGKNSAAEILQKENRKFEMNQESDEVTAELVGLLAYKKFKTQKSTEKNLDPIYLRTPRITERKK